MNDQPSPLTEARAGTTEQRTLLLHRSIALPCPYLPGRLERRVMTELTPAMVREGMFDDLTAAGFRRSHNMVYRPACPSCSACVPVRIVVERFVARRTLQRLWKGAADLAFTVVPAVPTAEQYALFHRYQLARHGDGDMALMDFQDYRQLVEESVAETRLVEVRDPAGRLVGCGLFDSTTSALSAVYSFYDPTLTERGLGSVIVLWLVEQAKATGRRHLYLGYWIEDCRKMSYKRRFRPLEALGPDGWNPLPDGS